MRAHKLLDGAATSASCRNFSARCTRRHYRGRVLMRAPVRSERAARPKGTGHLDQPVVGLTLGDGRPDSVVTVGTHGEPGLVAGGREGRGVRTQTEPDEVRLGVREPPSLLPQRGN